MYHCWEIDIIMTLDDVLSMNKDLVSISSYNPRTARCAVKLKHLKTHVIVALRQLDTHPPSEKTWTRYKMSHAIKTPLMVAPYRINWPCGEDQQDAISRAIADLVTDYRLAIDAGHKPDESWLIPT